MNVRRDAYQEVETAVMLIASFFAAAAQEDDLGDIGIEMAVDLAMRSSPKEIIGVISHLAGFAGRAFLKASNGDIDEARSLLQRWAVNMESR